MKGNGRRRPRLVEKAVRDERRRQLESARAYAEIEASGHYLLRGATGGQVLVGFASVNGSGPKEKEPSAVAP